MKKKKKDFIIAQYNKMWESMYNHLRLSWQIPAFTLVIISALLTTASEKLNIWENEPVLSGISFLVLAFAISVLFIHHNRNRVFAKEYETEIKKMEQLHGIETEAHHGNISKKLKGLNKISSTNMLTYFLFFLIILSISAGCYFLYLFIETLNLCK